MAGGISNGPLNEEHFQQIVIGIQAADRGLEEIAQAKRAGIDTGDAEQRLRADRERLTTIKQVYFPGR